MNDPTIIKTDVDGEGAGKARSWAGGLFLIVVFFPILLAEKVVRKRLSRRYASLVYLVLGLAAIAGLYDLLLGTPGAWFYDQAISFSDRSLLNSLISLGIVQAAKWAAIVIPPLSAVVGEVADWIVKGVIALAMQSALLRLAQAGFLLKYLLGAGLLLCVFPATERVGLKLSAITLIVFLTLPAVVSGEALLFEHFTARLEASLEEEREKIGSIPDIATDAVLGSVSGIRQYWNTLTGDTEEAKRLEEMLAEKPSVRERLRSVAMTLFTGLIYLLLLTLFTCVAAPFIAYWVLFRLAFSLLGRVEGLSLRAREAAGP